MTDRAIHIISLDVPFPPDYGGVIDIYYRCKALKEAGFHITLHCFEYGRGTTHDFHAVADTVWYYSRKKNPLDLLVSLPFIVQTRRSDLLLQRLLADESPIIFEGQHTTFLLDHPALNNRKKMVRLHNIEWQYYEALARRASGGKRIFFRMESRKLKQHERVFSGVDCIACLSATDTEYYRKINPATVYLPAGFDSSLPEMSIVSENRYALLHGNLSIAENDEAVRWLVKATVRKEVTIPIIIAGKIPSAALITLINETPGMELIANPAGTKMDELIHNASVHLLISFQHSGIKLKLLTALQSGKPCLATPQILAGTGLEQFCTVIHTEYELLKHLAEIPLVSDEEREERLQFLATQFGPQKTVSVMEEWLKDN